LLGFGGIIGGVAGGIITQYFNTHWIFYIYGSMGFLIMISGYLMNNDIEAEQISVIQMSLGQRVKQNFSDIKSGFKVKELWRSFIFFFLLGCLVPSFQDFFYYYQLEVVGFSKLTYALCGSLGFFYLVIAMQLYNSYLKERETTTMMVIACFTNLLGSVGCILFVR
jgi:MFS family permease